VWANSTGISQFNPLGKVPDLDGGERLHVKLRAQCPQAGERPTRPADPVTCRAASDAAAAPVLAALKAKLAAAADDAARILVERDLRNLDEEAARRRELDCQPVKYAPTEAWRRTQHEEILMSPRSPGARPEILLLDAPETT